MRCEDALVVRCDVEQPTVTAFVKLCARRTETATVIHDLSLALHKICPFCELWFDVIPQAQVPRERACVDASLLHLLTRVHRIDRCNGGRGRDGDIVRTSQTLDSTPLIHAHFLLQLPMSARTRLQAINQHVMTSARPAPSTVAGHLAGSNQSWHGKVAPDGPFKPEKGRYRLYIGSSPSDRTASTPRLHGTLD